MNPLPLRCGYLEAPLAKDLFPADNVVVLGYRKRDLDSILGLLGLGGDGGGGLPGIDDLLRG